MLSLPKIIDSMENSSASMRAAKKKVMGRKMGKKASDGSTKRLFKTELAALAYLKERGVADVECPLDGHRRVSIGTAIEGATAFRGLEKGPFRLATWASVGITKLVLSNAEAQPIYVETLESAEARAVVAEDLRQYEEFKRVEQENKHIRAKLTEGQCASAVLCALSRGEQITFVAARDKHGNMVRVGLIGVWMACGGYVMTPDARVHLADDWANQIIREGDPCLQSLVAAVRAAQSEALDRHAERRAAYYVAKNVWFPADEERG